MKARWQHPKVLGIDEAGEAFGDCLDGSTATTTSCADGQSTAVANSPTPSHACMNGGVAEDFPGCSTGTSFVALPKACYDGMVVE